MEPTTETTKTQGVPAPLERHTDTSQGTSHTSITRRTLWRRLALAMALVLILLCVSTGLMTYISKDSLPGEQLYTIKTQVVETVLLHTKLSADARASYDLLLMEERLQELTLLANDHSTTSSEILMSIATSMSSHVHDATATLARSTSLTTERRIDITAQLSSVTRAGEILTDDTEELASVKDSLEETHQVASDSLDALITEFASTSAGESVNAYLATQIQGVSTSVSQVARGSRAERLAVARIKNTQEAILDGNTADALAYILKAREAIAVDHYLFDSERGPSEGATTEPTTAPLGS